MRPHARPDMSMVPGDPRANIPVSRNLGASPQSPVSVETLPPTFSEFSESPAVKFLNARTQMQMYDALYGRSQPSPSYFTGMDASGGMRV